MNETKIQIVDRGRGPQIEGHRLTVLDVFYYLHRGYDFEFIQKSMPSLTREQFDAVVEYVDQHHDELIERDRLADERFGKGVAEQRARGVIFAAPDENLSTEERVARLREIMERKMTEKNGARHPD